MFRHTLLSLLLLAVPAAATDSIHLTGKTCGKLTPPAIDSRAPRDVEGGLAQPNFNTVQRAADIFSWQQFIALNWPAAHNQPGVPDPAKPINAPGPRVWETWKEAYEVYMPGGKRPEPWGQAQVFPAACQGGDGKLLLRSNKVDDVVDATLQALPAQGDLPASLKDQQGHLVRYEIRLNKPLFDYLMTNQLYDGRTQLKVDAVTFPEGSQLVKAAWRELGGDDPARYFAVSNACVCEDKGVDTPTNCSLRRMGLAGFHLMTKTRSAPQWIWSTYEQVDNTTPSHGAVQPLNNPHCPAGQCPPNRQTRDGVPTQLTRVIPIPSQEPDCAKKDQARDNIARLNTDVQKALAGAGSVLANYELVNTQWPIPASQSPRKTEFQVLPALLGNTTMESFSQETSSCMGCHVMSRTLRPDRFVSSDFSFTLNNAQPQPKGARCVSVEASESCSDDILKPPGTKESAAVRHGYQVSTQTYEAVGRPWVGNKLHCQSCHLNAGGNPNASWWVDMSKYYSPRAKLQERINSCFTNSMNGKAPCTPGADCDKNADMSGLVAYMDWLTAQYYAKHPKGTPARYFPGQQQHPEWFTKAGNAQRGSAIYTQKCAFCHNTQGQGRYLGGYFRPAQWGKDSYNFNAGMGGNATLAAFLYSNMPYTSGGLLSLQESADLAAFINNQCRPGKTGCKDH